LLIYNNFIKITIALGQRLCYTIISVAHTQQNIPDGDVK
jgi:hypothetical protein